MAYKRSDINGTTPLDLKNINDNFRNLWYKVFGDIDFQDMNNNVKTTVDGKLGITSTGNVYLKNGISEGAGKYILVQLPDEFKGKNFTVMTQIKSITNPVAETNKTGWFLSFFNVYIRNINTINGTFEVYGYCDWTRGTTIPVEDSYTTFPEATYVAIA